MYPVLFHFLFRYIIQKEKDASRAHQIKLDLIVKTLKWLEVDMDVDEVIASILFLFLSLPSIPAIFSHCPCISKVGLS